MIQPSGLEPGAKVPAAPKAGCLADDEECVPELLDPDDDVVEGEDELPPVAGADVETGVVCVCAA
jgi:hypothetical protein